MFDDVATLGQLSRLTTNKQNHLFPRVEKFNSREAIDVKYGFPYLMSIEVMNFAKSGLSKCTLTLRFELHCLKEEIQFFSTSVSSRSSFTFCADSREIFLKNLDKKTIVEFRYALQYTIGLSPGT